MLMRTDPFRDFDRLAQQVLGTAARPAVMPMDAWREGDQFIVEFDLPGVDEDSLDLDVERNVLTVHAKRADLDPDREMVSAERPRGVFSRQLFLGENARRRCDRGQLRRRGVAVDHPGRRESQTAPDQDRQRGQASNQRLTTAAPQRWARGAASGEGGERHGDRHRDGQPACSMRRRRSWRPNGSACSRTRPCGSVSSLTCSPRCLRPGPPRPASASPPPGAAAPANRCQSTVAGGRRGDGSPCRYGLPSGPLRHTRASC